MRVVRWICNKSGSKCSVMDGSADTSGRVCLEPDVECVPQKLQFCFVTLVEFKIGAECVTSLLLSSYFDRTFELSIHWRDEHLQFPRTYYKSGKFVSVQ